MTTINCSFNCIYQNEGTCNLDNIGAKSISFSSKCIFYEEKSLRTITGMVNDNQPTDEK